MHIFKKNRVVILLVFIIVLGAVLRTVNLGTNPAGFFCDEASVGYNAYSILHTGKDEWGNQFPLFFKAFGEYKNPVDIYFTLPFIALFGLSETAVRLTSVFFSVVSIIVFYFIGKELQSKKLGLICAGIFAITPWTVHMGRINWEGQIPLLFFTLLTLYFLVLSNKRKNTIYLFLFSFTAAVATYCYFPARIIIPPFVLFSLLFYSNQTYKNKAFVLLSYIFLLIPLSYHVIFQDGLARWNQVSLLKNHKINLYVKFFHTFFLHFSPQFLFLDGDIGKNFITRHSVRGIGEFYLWQLPFIFLGIIEFLKKEKKFFFLVFFLLLLYPISSSLTEDVLPQATRSVIGIIPFTFLTGYGLLFLLDYQNYSVFKKWYIPSFLTGIILLSFFQFILLYSQYPRYSSDYWGWQYGPKPIMNYFLKEHTQYDELYMTGEFNSPEIFLKFYDPKHICKNCFIGGIEHLNHSKKQLFAISKEDFKPNFFEVKKIINYPNKDIAFYIATPL